MDVTLVLKANNSDYVNKMKQAQKATQDVYTTAEKGSIKQRGLIDKEIQRVEMLTERRKNAQTNETLVQYNKLLEQSKSRLSELENAGLKTQKSSDLVTKSVMRMAAAYLSVHAVVKVLQETVLSFYTKSEKGIDLLERKFANFKAQLGVIQGEFIKLGEAFNKPAKEQSVIVKSLADVWKFTSNAVWTVAKGALNFIPAANNYFKDLGKTMKEAGTVAEELTMRQQELDQLEIDMIVPRAKANLAIKEARTIAAEHTGTIVERIDALQKAIDLENKTADEEIATQSKKVEIIRLLNAEKEKTGRLTREDQKILAEALAEEIRLRTESYGRQFRALNAINALMDEYKRKQKESQPEGKITGNIYDETGLTTGILRNKEGDIDKVIITASQKLKAGWAERLKTLAKGKETESKAIEDQNKKDIETDKKAWEDKVEIAKRGVETIKNLMDMLMDARYQDAQRRRELLDSQVSELEEELQTEVELYKAGYAANVSAKKVELEKTKKLRDQALREEESALKKKRTIEAASQAVDIASSIMSLLRMTFKNSKTWWQALISAGVGVAAMYGLIESSKSKIPEATRLATGASGTKTGVIRGRSHADGGERFLNHVEVERGESWGVLSVPASQKFGKVFHQMVSSFNRGELPIITPAGKVDNKVFVNNSGSNSRLDQLIAENRKLNNKLSKGTVYNFDDKTVIIKGDTVKTIRR